MPIVIDKEDTVRPRDFSSWYFFGVELSSNSDRLRFGIGGCILDVGCWKLDRKLILVWVCWDVSMWVSDMDWCVSVWFSECMGENCMVDSWIFSFYDIIRICLCFDLVLNGFVVFFFEKKKNFFILNIKKIWKVSMKTMWWIFSVSFK